MDMVATRSDVIDNFSHPFHPSSVYNPRSPLSCGFDLSGCTLSLPSIYYKRWTGKDTSREGQGRGCLWTLLEYQWWLFLLLLQTKSMICGHRIIHLHFPRINLDTIIGYRFQFHLPEGKLRRRELVIIFYTPLIKYSHPRTDLFSCKERVKVILFHRLVSESINCQSIHGL